MIVDKSVFDQWLMDNPTAVLEVIPTPAATIDAYKDENGNMLAYIAKPADGSSFVYELV